MTIFVGVGLSMLIAAPIGAAASQVGTLIMWATEQAPLIMGILVSVIVGVALTLPISSAAICAALGLTGLAGGAAVTGGLKPFGREALRRMEDNNIIADVSHLNDESFWGVIKAARRPVIATHSNSRRLCNVPRNLTDDQFGCIAERGGLVGLNFYTGFLREDREHACMEDILRHAEHFLNLGGEDVLALGSDFDGAAMPDDLPDCGALPMLFSRLTDAFGLTISEKICYKNSLDFWRRYDAN